MQRRKWQRVTALIFSVLMIMMCIANTIIVSHGEEPESEPLIFIGGSEMVGDVPSDELLGKNPELSSEIIFQIDDEIEEITPGAVIEEPIEIREFKEPENLPLPEHLTRSGGVFYGPSGKETYYNLNMSRCIDIMRSLGYDYEVWVRDDGVKMYGYYVMIAANTYVNPKGTIIDTSLGKGIVVDHCVAAERSNIIDIAVTW